MTGLSLNSSVCALVPHYACEQWLDQAVSSLREQTRPPDAVVVLDDASERPPVDIVAAHPGVTLLTASDNGGPYRLIQAVIDATGFDAYLFQDADDWSAPDRLERLLAEAERTGAELVGGHEVRVLTEEGDVVPVAYPLDVNEALRARSSCFPLLHPTSLVGRDLVRRVGGFATGMRFSGDAEFLRRAAHVARVVNVDHFGYFRRKRPGSLTTDPDTALRSPNRLAVQKVLAERAGANAAAVADGRAPDLRPWRIAAPAALAHLAGPVLDHRPPARRILVRDSQAIAPRQAPAPAGQRPVFVIGAPRSGTALLAWALGQHRALSTVIDPRWLARLAADVEHRAADDAAPAPADTRAWIRRALGELAGGRGLRPVAGGVEITGAAHALLGLFPDARFIHLVRDPADVVTSLVGAPTEEGVFYSLDAAWRAWITGVEAGLAVEEALGAGSVMRLTYRSLVDDPVRALDTCLTFLDEPVEPACARPLSGLAAPAAALVAQTSDALVTAVAGIQQRLAAGTPRDGDAPARARMAKRFARRHLSSNGTGATLVDRLRLLVAHHTPEGARVVVISRGDPRLVDLDEREGWHFPQVDGGAFAGHYPEDSDGALRHLDELRARGAEYLAVPASSAWWLDFYEGLRVHLAEEAQLVAYGEEVGAVFRLGPGEDPVRYVPVARLQLGVPP